MTIALRTFLSSMTFGAIVGAVYWLLAREPVGSALLFLFAAGLFYVAAFLALARRRVSLSGDRDVPPSRLAGEEIGDFSLESPWPPILALASAALLVGIVLHPMLAAFALVAFFTILWQLVREST